MSKVVSIDSKGDETRLLEEIDRALRSGRVIEIAKLVGEAKNEVIEQSGRERLTELEQLAMLNRYVALLETGRYTVAEALVVAGEKPWFNGPSYVGGSVRSLGDI